MSKPNTAVQVFTFADQHNVRLITDENQQPWFIAKDVCDVLEIVNVTQALFRLDDDERSMFNIGRQGDVNIVNESGLYSLILSSRKPEAKKFKKWVTSEVLPIIRKTGAYQTQIPEFTTTLSPQDCFLKHHKVATKLFAKNAERVQYANALTKQQTGVDILAQAQSLVDSNPVAFASHLPKDHAAHAQTFWDNFHALSAKGIRVDTYIGDADLVAININYAQRQFAKHKLPVAPFKDLAKGFHQLATPKLIAAGKTIWVAKPRKALRVWIFEVQS